MAVSDYHFKTTWRLLGSAAEVSHVIADDAIDLKRWWPSVYLDAWELEPGDASGIGKVVSLHTTGWLPYTLRWQLRVAEFENEKRLVIEATGDFIGRGEWTFTQEGDEAVVNYDWRVHAAKPLLRTFSAVLRPAFAANHHWAMRQGFKSLVLELARRHATSPDQASLVPVPPGPTSPRVMLLPLACAAFVAGAAWWTRRIRSR